MFTDPQIYNPQDLSKRGFISFRINGIRYRYYSGNGLNIQCFPNTTSTLAERERLLKHLLREYTRALLKGWIPETEKKTEVKKPELLNLLAQLVRESSQAGYSRVYQRDFSRVSEQFSEFLIAENCKSIQADQVKSSDIERFLQQFSSTGTYYQNKRRTLSAVFSRLVKQGYCITNPVVTTTKRKAKSVLHQSYAPEQLTTVLQFLRAEYPNLYLCALLMYGTLLRPHREVRLLRRRHFNADLTSYMLDGSENKSGRLRSLPLPEYVRAELLNRKVDQLDPDDFLFTEGSGPYNESYFNTMWSRAKVKMLKLGIIKDRQTLYSFRHTASINVFERTQNLKMLQQLLGHSNLNTSITYLRSLGMVGAKDMVLPTL